MKHPVIFPMLLLCFMLSLCACGQKEPDPPGTMPPPAPAENPRDVTWNFQKNAIGLTIISSSNLNVVQGVPHSVSICLYQTENPDLLKAKAETEEGLRELLLCKSSPPERFQAQQIYVQPNTIVEKMLDRAENAKYLAVVAGFNILNSKQSFSIIPIPLQTTKTKGWNIFTQTSVYSVADMEARIDLSSESVYLQGIERVQK